MHSTIAARSRRRPDDRQHRDPRAPLAGGRKRGTQRQGFGRSKGGFTSKIYLITNAYGLPVRAEVTGGEVSDFKGFDVMVDDDLPIARVFLADRGYDSDHIRKTIAERGGTPVIPAKANRKEPILRDTVTYALRNRTERCVAKLKCSRRLAIRYDKTSASYLGFMHIAAARLWNNQFVNRALMKTARSTESRALAP
ncbi:MAG: IS5 family transposase [Pseudomonadota bacterium]